MLRFHHKALCSLMLLVCFLFALGCNEKTDSAIGQESANPDKPPMKDHAPNQAKHGERASKKYTNRLAKETSPYLLLHAHNPVNWYPWGPEALAEAKKKNKLIFLSIGYSSCYWCHVMERESFTNEKIAAYMNEHFVSIKVDREERPDVDDIYMTSLHVLGGRGGWPLSMFLTPDAKPITGGTYYPPEDKYGRLGFLTVLNKIQGAWEKQREKLLKQADTVANLVQKNLQQRPPATPIKLNNALVDAVLVGLERSYRPAHAETNRAFLG